jgi:uncharacterized protein YjbJ (UPF0337 family)
LHDWRINIKISSWQWRNCTTRLRAQIPQFAFFTRKYRNLNHFPEIPSFGRSIAFVALEFALRIPQNPTFEASGHFKKFKEAIMNWDQIAGKWKQSKGRIRERWGKLTEDDLEVIAGEREQLVGLLQERYGVVKDAAEEQINEFLKSCHEETADQKRAAGGR